MSESVVISERDTEAWVARLSWVEEVTDEQIYICWRMSRMMREVLTIMETAIPDGRQQKSLKRLLNNAMYGARNDMLKELTGVQVPEDREE